LGPERMRVIAGKAEPLDEALARSAASLETLARDASAAGVRLMTENWFQLLSRPDAVHALLGRLDGQVGLCLDFGNWSGPGKYDDLAAIAPLAESCHAKAQFVGPGEADGEDYRRCLDLTRTAGFRGPYTLIYDGPDDDEPAGLTLERELVRPYLAG
jgi:sugar phosphate isomerase/epimerase